MQIMKIIFMGTSDFAVPTLQKILQNKELEVVAVFTKAPSISGRGNKIQYSPIHNLANQHNLKIFTPKTLKDEEIQQEFSKLKPDIAIVISYGLILPQNILNIPKFGCFNVHPSDLPFYRGSAPLQRSIMNGETQSAVCIIKMDSGLDSGDIVNKIGFIIGDTDNYLTISKKTSEIGADLILKTIEQIKNNQFPKASQQEASKASYAHKIEKVESLIDWNQNCHQIFNKIRALRGNLDAYFKYGEEKIKILECEFVREASKNYQSGIIVDDKFSISCADGLIMPKILQRQGKNEVKIGDFLNGFKFEIGKKLDIVG